MRGVEFKPGSNLVNYYLAVNLDEIGYRDKKAESPIPHVMVVLAIPLHEYIIDFPAKYYFQSLLQIDTVSGDFSDSFPDLSNVSDGLYDLPIGSLRNYLLKKRESAKQNIQIMGLTFPASILRVASF